MDGRSSERSEAEMNLLCTMRKLVCCAIVIGSCLSCGLVAAQKKDSIQKTDKLMLLIYSRIISDNNGNVRIDENFVPNIRLNKLLKLELGIRQGERPQRFDSYYHYKIELQTKSFWKMVRFIARLSDNVIKYPSPNYAKSNYLFIAESKFPLSKSFVALVAGGYVFTRQQNNTTDGLPSVNTGDRNDYPTFKLAIRYLLRDRGFVEAVYGAYDVFNPYLLTSPFLQTTFEYEITERTELYSYFRYQYNSSLAQPLNDFIGLGVKLHFKN
jgi:hypothetical protein